MTLNLKLLEGFKKYFLNTGWLFIGNISRMLASLLVWIWVASSRWLLTENLQIFSTINTFIGSAINILLNYIFITYVGIQGAALATLISYFIAAYFSLVFLAKD